MHRLELIMELHGDRLPLVGFSSTVLVMEEGPEWGCRFVVSRNGEDIIPELVSNVAPSRPVDNVEKTSTESVGMLSRLTRPLATWSMLCCWSRVSIRARQEG